MATAAKLLGHEITHYNVRMTEESNEASFKGRIRHYAEALNPLFDSTLFMTSDRLFEYVCVLVRAGGLQGQDWDPWYESQDTLDDLGNLSTLELPTALFSDPARTRVRLSLLSYCHLTEMDLPYSLAANLLRLRLGKKYDMTPFRDLFKPIGKKDSSLFQKMRPPSPGAKIGRIRELAEAAHVPDVAQAFESIYDRVIRNAVYHSDYTLSRGEFRMLSGYRVSRKKGHGSPVVEWDELSELFMNTFAFHTALFSLYERCRKSFGDFKDALIPYDGHYKGILQMVFDEEQRLTGFRVYWPNATVGEYNRTRQGSTGVNLTFDPDGSINFMVGLYASNRSVFSPLVERGQGAAYAEVPGARVRPHWPEDLKIYKLSSGESEYQKTAETH